MIRRTISSVTFPRLIVAMVLAASLPRPSWSAELLYYLTAPKDAPKQESKIKTLEGDPIFLEAEPVAKLSSDSVKEARITKESVDGLDEGANNIIYLVAFTVDPATQEKIETTMGGLCHTKPGIHVVFQDVAIDYQPFAVCGNFPIVVSFLEKDAADRFAHAFAKQVVYVTPTED